jgi:hypothetical protein
MALVHINGEIGGGRGLAQKTAVIDVKITVDRAKLRDSYVTMLIH